ncbi:hypothetical protein ACIQUM_07895 [Amycolatopsis azurea]|uniref:hypothetical protein n=1 Tax=Amycolatopsis azurea TaxID=36819 RepID=UPI0038222C4F
MGKKPNRRTSLLRQTASPAASAALAAAAAAAGFDEAPTLFQLVSLIAASTLALLVAIWAQSEASFFEKESLLL